MPESPIEFEDYKKQKKKEFESDLERFYSYVEKDRLE